MRFLAICFIVVTGGTIGNKGDTIQRRKSVQFMSEAEQEQQNEITLQIDWHVPEGVQSRYANNTLVQAGPSEIVISFFEMQLPMLLGTPEENKGKLEETGKIRAECVSKVIIPPQLVPGLINALQIELERFQSQRPKQ